MAWRRGLKCWFGVASNETILPIAAGLNETKRGHVAHRLKTAANAGSGHRGRRLHWRRALPAVT